MQGKRLLDVGAHWLHQSTLWRADGYSVIATDVGLTLDLPCVKAQPAQHDIRLISYARMDDGLALASVADQCIDVVLFCEILEHITFNPMSLWGEIYRVLAPGGGVIVTTPNYYWMRGRFWDWKRVRERMGGGLPVQEILRVPTYGSHWKEYSLHECIEYFNALSNDMQTVRAEYVPDPRPLPSDASLAKRFNRRVENRIHALRWWLHIEVEKRGHSAGMAIVPSW